MSYETQYGDPSTAYIATFSGKMFTPLAPKEEDIEIEDIAHALSNICRYTGHVKEFYSVAQHCVLCSWLAPPGYMLEALLHDASEAYLSDIAGPLKKFLPDYQAAEERLDRVARGRFGLPLEMSEVVKEIDYRMLVTEARAFEIPWWREWVDRGVHPYSMPIVPWAPDVAERRFLKRYRDLTEGRR